MAENSRRVSVDKYGNTVGGLKPRPDGERRAKTAEELAEEAKNRADNEAAEKIEGRRQYQQGLAAYKRGDAKGAGFGFTPKPEDAKEANDANGLARGQRNKDIGDYDRFQEANRPQGKTGAFPAEMDTPGYNVIKPRKASWDSSTGEWKMPEGMKKGGKVSSASSRGDGIAKRGKTKGRMC
jgi:hypothetical protein